MMKLKVVDDYKKVVVVEADTIDTLKARIMDSFSLKEEDLSQRLLVPDGRDMRAKLPFCTPMVKALDLLGLPEGSILSDYWSCDCRLLLGWKGPFIISLFPLRLNIKVDPYVTLGELKREIKRVTRGSQTVENLPRILYWGNNKRPLIFYGLYKYYKRMVKLRINCNEENIPTDLRYMKSFRSFCIFRPEPSTPLYFGEKYDAEEEMNNLKVLVKDEYVGEDILVPLTDVLLNPKKKGGDKEPAGCYYKEYHPSKKRWKKMMNIVKEEKKQKREPGYREPVEEEEEVNC